MDLTTSAEKHTIHVFVEKCLVRLKEGDRELPQVRGGGGGPHPLSPLNPPPPPPPPLRSGACVTSCGVDWRYITPASCPS